SEQRRVCMHCRGDENRLDDPWVPYMFAREPAGWVHQSCQHAWDEKCRARDAADATAERKDRLRKIARNAGLFAVWVFVMWFGFTAIDFAENGNSSGSAILSLYVLFTAFG